MSASVNVSVAARSPSEERFAITVAFAVKPSWRAHFLKLVRINAAASLKVEVGCLCFDVLAPFKGDGTDILLYEVYKDRAAFESHLASSHFLTFDEATRDMLLAKTVSEFRVEAPLIE